MIKGLRAGELGRFEGLIHAVARAARARECGAFAIYVLDVGDAREPRFARALRFARAVHRLHPAAPDPMRLMAEWPRAREPYYARSAAVELVARVAEVELGKAIGAQVRAVHATGAVPVLVAGAPSLVASLDGHA